MMLEAISALGTLSGKVVLVVAPSSSAVQVLAAIREGKSSLIVAPTHAESRAIAGVVRDLRKKEGLLSPEEHTLRRLEELNLTESQRRDAINYHLFEDECEEARLERQQPLRPARSPLGLELNVGANLQKPSTRRIGDRLVNYIVSVVKWPVPYSTKFEVFSAIDCHGCGSIRD
jgi:hypothetical protein